MIIFQLILAVAANASAVTYDSSLHAEFDKQVQQGRFYKPEEVPYVPRNFERANKATVRIGDYGEACTGVILSPEGYVATAAHCLGKCLLPSFDYTPPIKSETIAKPGLFEVTHFLENAPSPFECQDYVASTLVIDDYQLQSPKIIWVGRGMLGIEDLTKLTDQDFAKIKGLGEDIVILKYERADSSVNVPCEPIAAQRPKAGSAVFGVGFPVPGNDPYFIGYHKAVTLGRVRASIQDDPTVQKVALQLTPEKAALYLGRQSALWNTDDHLLTSVQGAHGNSGGALLNENGELAGIVFAGVNLSVDYQGQTLVGVSVPELTQQMSHDLGLEAVEQIFNCPRELQTSN